MPLYTNFTYILKKIDRPPGSDPPVCQVFLVFFQFSWVLAWCPDLEATVQFYIILLNELVFAKKIGQNTKSYLKIQKMASRRHLAAFRIRTWRPMKKNLNIREISIKRQPTFSYLSSKVNTKPRVHGLSISCKTSPYSIIITKKAVDLF